MKVRRRPGSHKPTELRVIVLNHPHSQMVLISWLTSAVTTSNGIALARCHKQSGRLTSCISLFTLTWLQAGIYRRQLHDGAQSCLTRMADSEHILIYSPGPGAVFTGLNTSSTHSAETSSAARRVSWFSLPYNVSLIIPVGKLLQLKIKRFKKKNAPVTRKIRILLLSF